MPEDFPHPRRPSSPAYTQTAPPFPSLAFLPVPLQPSPIFHPLRFPSFLGGSPCAWNPAPLPLVKLSPAIILQAPEIPFPPQSTHTQLTANDFPPASQLFWASAAPSPPCIVYTKRKDALSTQWLQHPERPFLCPSVSEMTAAWGYKCALLVTEIQ